MADIMDFEKKIDEGISNTPEDAGKKKKRKWLLLLLLLLIIIFGAGGLYSLGRSNRTSFAMDNLPQVTYDEDLKLHGCGATPGAKLRIVINGGEAQFVEAGEDGCFSLLTDLSEGENRIETSIVGQEAVVESIINYIIKAPVLNITEPKDGATINSKDIIVKGITDLDAKITVNGKEVAVNENGTFETKVTLIGTGNSEIKVIADNGKKTTEDVITVKLVDGNAVITNPPPVSTDSGNIPDNASGDTGNGSNNNGGNHEEPTPEPIVIYPSKVIISYILYSNDPEAAGFGEYVELKNTGDENKDITGWTVSDSDGNTFVFPSYSLAPGATVRVTTNAGRFVFNSNSPVWNKVGEVCYLKDTSGRLVDVYSY